MVNCAVSNQDAQLFKSHLFDHKYSKNSNYCKILQYEITFFYFNKKYIYIFKRIFQVKSEMGSAHLVKLLFF